MSAGPEIAVSASPTVGEAAGVEPQVSRRGLVVAVANQKGGVGKTTTTVNVAAGLAELGARALVLDMDPQANATTALGVDPRVERLSVVDALLRDLPLETLLVETAVAGLCLGPASPGLADAELELVPQLSRELRLRRALAPVRDRFDYVLVDCPPSLGLLTVNGLAAAQTVLVPMQAEYYALEGLTQLLRTLRLVQENLQPTLALGAIVLTMFDPRSKLAAEVEDEVRRHFGDTVCATVIPRSVRLSEAPSFGQPITLFDPISRGAASYRALAKEVDARAARWLGTGAGLTPTSEHASS